MRRKNKLKDNENAYLRENRIEALKWMSGTL